MKGYHTVTYYKMGSMSSSTFFSLISYILFAVISSGSTKINGTEDVAKLMGELFDDNNGACETPALELGFLVAESYNEPPTGKERTFRKALKLVKETAQKIKISDSGTHVGLVVYGKKPYMVFDFNEYFDMRSLSRAIEEVKTPAQGSRVGEALTFTKEQLYDKSARPGIPRALIVLSSKKSEDRIEHGVNTLKKAGVKIYTVGIGTEGDSMETSGMASDVPDTFYVDQDHLKTSVTKLVAKLCEDSKGKSIAEELKVTSDEPDSKMNPEEEPSPSKNIVSLNGEGSPSQPSQLGNEGPRPNKVDLVFLIQSSGKMGFGDWKKTISFMKYVTHAFDVSSSESRVGLIVEGKTFHVVLDFNRITKKTLLLALAGLIPIPFGDLKIGKGLKDVEDLVINPSGRDNIPDVVIVLTDGKSVDDVKKPAKSLQDSGAEIYAIGLGDNISLGQLEEIASFPSRKYVYHGDYKDVVQIASQIVAQIYDHHFCGGLSSLLRKLLHKEETRKRTSAVQKMVKNKAHFKKT